MSVASISIGRRAFSIRKLCAAAEQDLLFARTAHTTFEKQICKQFSAHGYSSALARGHTFAHIYIYRNLWIFYRNYATTIEFDVDRNGVGEAAWYVKVSHRRCWMHDKWPNWSLSKMAIFLQFFYSFRFSIATCAAAAADPRFVRTRHRRRSSSRLSTHRPTWPHKLSSCPMLSVHFVAIV